MRPSSSSRRGNGVAQLCREKHGYVRHDRSSPRRLSVGGEVLMVFLVLWPGAVASLVEVLLPMG